MRILMGGLGVLQGLLQETTTLPFFRILGPKIENRTPKESYNEKQGPSPNVGGNVLPLATNNSGIVGDKIQGANHPRFVLQRRQF